VLSVCSISALRHTPPDFTVSPLYICAITCFSLISLHLIVWTILKIDLDTYRFFAYNQHCRHIFLACCHDNGYVAELDKYRYDTTAAPKTILVHAAQAAREYASLPFPVARFGSVFEVRPHSFKPSVSHSNDGGNIAD
jgi:hypothetical protein